MTEEIKGVTKEEEYQNIQKEIQHFIGRKITDIGIPPSFSCASIGFDDGSRLRLDGWNYERGENQEILFCPIVKGQRPEPEANPSLEPLASTSCDPEGSADPACSAFSSEVSDPTGLSEKSYPVWRFDYLDSNENVLSSFFLNLDYLKDYCVERAINRVLEELRADGSSIPFGWFRVRADDRNEIRKRTSNSAD